MDVHREEATWGHREGSHPQAKVRDFRRNQTCQHFYFGLLASRTVRK